MTNDPNPKIRVRFAPSPTGKLHIGTARTTLFNYLFAKKENGVFVLRIEDTDLERSDPEFEKDIIDGLIWLGIEWDEGPAPISQREIGELPISNSQFPKKYVGDYGPYRQSERLSSYAKYLEKLLHEKKAYHCFCSEQDLEAQRQYRMSIGQPPIYSGKCAGLSEEKLKEYLTQGKPFIIRFKNSNKKIIFKDLIRGELEFDSSLTGDFAIAKNLTAPLYNFAVVVDDFEMKITHVVRGEDHISNTPKQILIQESLGFPRPRYAHLPLILGPDRSKLSKRHGAVALSDYKEQGYLPEAMVNFMAFLGWNPGGEREIFSLASLCKEFSLEKVQKGGAVFNIKRLDYLNGFYIRQKSLDKLTELCLPYLVKAGLITPKPEPGRIGPKVEFLGAAGIEFLKTFIVNETKKEISFELLKKIAGLYRERLKKMSEISELTDFFFKDKLEYDKELLKWRQMTDKEIIQSLDQSEKALGRIKKEEFNKENLEKILLSEAEKFSKGITGKDLSAQALAKAGLPAEALAKAGDRGQLLWPLRVALTGKQASAPPFEIAEILGKEKCLDRIKEAKKLFAAK